MFKMKQVISSLLAVIVIIGLSGCVAGKATWVATEVKNIDDPYQDSVITKDKADMFLYSGTMRGKSFSIFVDNYLIDKLGEDDYLYYQLEPGNHFIISKKDYGGTYLIGRECINVEANKKYIYKLGDIGNNRSSSDLDNDLRQVKQNSKIVPKFSLDVSISSIEIETSEKSYMLSVKDEIKKLLKNIKLDKNSSKELTIKVLKTAYKEGSQLGRYFTTGLDVSNGGSREHRSYLYTKTIFYINGEKVDELDSSSSVGWGIFGGSSDLSDEIAEDIISYAKCKFNLNE